METENENLLDYEKLNELHQENPNLIIDLESEIFGEAPVPTVIDKIKRFMPFVAILGLLLILAFI